MNVRKVKDIVAEIRAFVDTLPKYDNSSILKKDDKNLDYIPRLVSAEGLDDFMALLERYKDYDVEANKTSLKPLTDWMVEYAGLANACEASYFYRPNILANQVTKQAANIIGTYLEIAPTTLIAPNIEGLDPNRKFSDYILIQKKDPAATGEVKHAILVEDVFAELEKKYLHDESIEISLEEEELASNHSALATDYYWALYDGKDNVQELKAQFLAALKDDNYQVTAKPSKTHQQVIQTIIDRKTNKNDFLKVFTNIPVKKWPEVMGNVQDKDLYRCMLGINDYDNFKKRHLTGDSAKDATVLSDELRKILATTLNLDHTARVNLDSYQDKYVRALLYLFCQTYIKTRSVAKEEFKSVTGQSTKKIDNATGGIFSKGLSYFVAPPMTEKEKIKVCEQLIDLVLDTKKQPRVPRRPLSEFKSSLLAKHPGLKGGVLGKLAKYLIAISDMTETQKAYYDHNRDKETGYHAPR